jgi:hypothetical protein
MKATDAFNSEIPQNLFFLQVHSVTKELAFGLFVI